MPEIQSLTDLVQHLSSAVDFWNRWMLIGLVLTAIAAAWLFVTTRMVIVRGKALSVAQSQLNSAKEAKLAIDLAAAQQRTAEIRKDNLVLQTEVLKLRTRTEFRHLSPDQQSSISRELMKFSGTRYFLGVYNAGDDASAIAGNIRTALDAAGWKEAGGFGTSASAPGIGIVIHLNPYKKTPTAEAAADALAQALRGEDLYVPPVRDAESGGTGGAMGAESVNSGSNWDIAISIQRRP